MTSPHCQPDIQTDEGYARELEDGSCTAYPDPLSGGEPWTIGYGCTGPGIVEGVVWTRDQAVAECSSRIHALIQDLDQTLPWWRTLSDLRQDVLVNMAYNLGMAGLLRFHHMLAYAEAHDYYNAAQEMLDSEWAKQVRHRAQRLADQMRTGVRQR